MLNIKLVGAWIVASSKFRSSSFVNLWVASKCFTARLLYTASVTFMLISLYLGGYQRVLRSCRRYNPELDCQPWNHLIVYGFGVVCVLIDIKEKIRHHEI